MAGASNGEWAMISARRALELRLADLARRRRPRRPFRQRDRKGEDRAAARVVLEGQRAAHQADDAGGRWRGRAPCLRNGVRRSRRPVRSPRRSRPAAPAARRGRCRRPRNAGPPVAARDRDADAARRGELHRVAGEVHQHLPQAHAVGEHEARRVGADRGGDLQPLALGARREQFDHALDELHRSTVSTTRPRRPGLDLGEIENLVDEREQRRPRAADGLDVAHVLGAERRVAQEVGHAENAVDRRADLVAHRGEEAGLGFARRLGPVARRGRFLQAARLRRAATCFRRRRASPRLRPSTARVPSPPRARPRARPSRPPAGSAHAPQRSRPCPWKAFRRLKFFRSGLRFPCWGCARL